jgi:Flp pilus assembly protein TadD
MAEAPYSLGAVLWQTGRADEAIAAFREAIHRRPAYAEAHFMLATILRQRGDPAAALTEFRAAVSANPQYAEAFTAIGQLLALQHDEAGSTAAFAEAERLSRRKSDSQAAAFAVNAGRERLAQGDVQGAIVRFRDAVRLAPDDAQAHYQLALALRRRGAVREAQAEYETARRLAPYLRW